MIHFSLVIPCYNSETQDRRPFLDELFASIPDRPDLEVILVDDHSAIPYSPERAFTNSRIRLIPNRVDRKFAGTARNTGIEEASGSILFFADSDDRFDGDTLSKVLDEIAEDQTTNLFIARCVSFKEDGSIGDRHLYMDEIHEEYQASRSDDVFARLHTPLAKFIRKSFVEQHGLEYGDSRVANDVLFNVRVISSGPSIRVLNELVYHIRQGNESLTNDPGRDAARTRIRVARQAQDVLRAAGRKDLRQPLAYNLLRYAKNHPTMVAGELLRSVLRGDRLVSSKRRAIRHLLRLS